MSSSVNLFIAQLDKRVTDAALEQEFKKFGPLISAQVTKDENGCSKGFGFVHFSKMADGLKAMEVMDGSMFYSRRIRVQTANKQEDSRTRNGQPRLTKWKNTNAHHFNEIVSSENKDTKENQTSFKNGLPPSSKWGQTNADQYSDLTSEATDSNGDEKNFTTKVSGVKQRMRQLFEQELHTDVIFYPKDNGNFSISGHKAILAVASPLFEKMLYGENSQSPPGVKLEIFLENLSFPAFTSIVRYLYTDEIFFENDGLAFDILYGAQQFEIHSLIDHCNSYIEKRELHAENVCSILKFSTENEMEVLKKRCLKYIQENTQPVLKSLDFLDSPPETIQHICKLESLSLKSEMELIDRVMIWLKNQSAAQRKEITESLLKCFRFLTLTIADMCAILAQYPDIINAADGLEILKYLTAPPNAPNNSSLPSWCNKSTNTRCSLNFVDPVPLHENAHNFADLSRNASKNESIVFPLKLSKDFQNVTSVTSLLKMRCIGGNHQIHAIKLAFQPPVNAKSTIGLLTIDISVSPSGFTHQQHIEIVNSLDVRVELVRKILARKGDVVDFKVKAQNIQFYKFFQLDHTSSPSNSHFLCTTGSAPQDSRIFCIREIEYTSRCKETDHIL